MSRWWDDPEAAAETLARVDGSDIEQGVGTAALGLHALAKAALAPLAGRTLVDAQQIQEALLEVDYTPVSKALATVTEPIMGEAAGPYGEFLARQWHADAIVGVSTMVKSLTSAGVPMPLAVERAAEAAGLPAKQTGQYVAAMRAPAVPPIVRADAADRALMDYARTLGHLEVATPVPDTEVSKDARFREEEHPRDRSGRFAEKPDSPDARRARMQRMNRFQQWRAAQAPVGPPPAVEETRGGSLRDLAGLVRPEPPRAEQARTDPRAEQRITPLRAVAEAARKITNPEPAPKAREEGKFLLEPASINTPRDVHVVELPQHQNHVALLSIDDAEEIMDAGGFVTQRLAQLLEDGGDGGRGILIVPADQAEVAFAEAQARGANMGRRMAVEFTGRVPIIDGGPGGEGMVIDPSARFKATNVKTANWDIVTLHETRPDYDEAQAGIWGAANLGSAQMPVLRMRLDNEKDYPGPIGKSRMETWDSEGRRHLRMVDRDDDGRFATRGSDSGRRERIARMQRVQQLMAQPRAVPAREVAEVDRSLRGLAGLVREDPRPEQARRDVRVEQRVEQVRVEQPRAEKPQQRKQQVAKPQAAPEPDTKPEVKATDRGLAAKDAAVISINDLMMMFGDTANLLLDPEPGGGGYVEAAADFEGKPWVKVKPAIDAISEWVDTGSKKWIGGAYASEEEARQAAQQRQLRRALSMGYPGEIVDDPYEPQVEVVQDKDGDFRPVMTYYNRSHATLIGSPAAMRAFKAGKPVEMRAHTENSVQDLAEKYGDPAGLFGSHPAHLVAIEVILPDDETEAR